MNPTASDRATAYHEAGHAVVASSLNIWVRRISIETSRMTLRDGRAGIADGYTDITRREKKKFRASKGRLIGADRLGVVHKIAYALAGHAASVQATGNEALKRPNDGDIAEVDHLLKRVAQEAPREDTNRLLFEGRELMARLLNERWADIERVAAAALRDHTLTEAQIRALLSGPSAGN